MNSEKPLIKGYFSSFEAEAGQIVLINLITTVWDCQISPLEQYQTAY